MPWFTTVCTTDITISSVLDFAHPLCSLESLLNALFTETGITQMYLLAISFKEMDCLGSVGRGLEVGRSSDIAYR